VTRRVAAGPLRDWAAALLAAAGLERAAAELVAETLVDASLRGVDSHGVARLAVYVERLRAGALTARPRPRVLRRDGALALLDGDGGPGQVAGVIATDLSVALAREHGVGAVAVRRSAHFGAAGFYAVRAARAGLVAVCTCNADPRVVPYAGVRPELGTNPIAVAAPTDGEPFVLDMATSQVAWNRIVDAREEGRSIPPGWAMDAAGRPTTDPAAAAAAVPLGGHKGYGLAIAVELLSAVLSGAGVAHGVAPLQQADPRPQDVGHFHLALDPERTVGRAAFAAALSALLAALRASPPAPGEAEVLVPGDPEARAAAERARDGVPLPAPVWTRLVAVSEALGVAVPAG